MSQDEKRSSRDRRTQKLLIKTASELKIDENLRMLKTIFSTWELDSLQLIFENQGFNLELTIDAIFRIEEADTAKGVEEKHASMHPSFESPDVLETTVSSFLNMSVQQREPEIKVSPPPPYFLETTVLDSFTSPALQRSRFDLNAAKSRIRDKDAQNPTSSYLSRASELYQRGVISGSELEHLRACILEQTFQFASSQLRAQDLPQGCLATIEEFQWHLLIIRSKGLSPYLSIQILDHHESPSSGYAPEKYKIQITDIGNERTWIVHRPFKELYKLHKKLSQLNPRIQSCNFPQRQLSTPRKKSSNQNLMKTRRPEIETFLRISASLVVPGPVSCLSSAALRELETFLETTTGVKGGKISNVVQAYVYHIVVNPLSPEGKACDRFLNKWKVSQTSKDDEESSHTHVLSELGEFLDNVQSYIMTHSMAMLKVLDTMSIRRSNSNTVVVQDEEEEARLRDIVRHVIEDVVLTPILPGLILLIHDQVVQDERKLLRRMANVRHQPQTYFDIPPEHISVSGWRAAVENLNELDDLRLPHEKLNALVNAAHRIHEIYQTERNQGDLKTSSSSSSEEKVQDDLILSGDDFLPICIYAIVQSNLVHPLVTLKMLMPLCDQEKRLGETGYYLACFEASLQHLTSMDTLE